MKIEILGAARQDLLDGYQFYEKQAEAVGAYFLDTLISDIDSLTVMAGVHSTHFGGYYRLPSKRFPLCRLLPDQEPDRPCLRCSRLSPQPRVDQKHAHPTHAQRTRLTQRAAG